VTGNKFQARVEFQHHVRILRTHSSRRTPQKIAV
jgi:hypothetical protein